MKRSKFVADCTSKKQARKMLAPWMEELNAANRQESEVASAVLFSDFVSKDWEVSIQNQGIAETTLYSWKSLLKNHLLPAFGGRPIDKIAPREISAFMGSKENFAQQTRRHFYTLLKLIFDAAVESDLISKTPVRSKLHRPQVERPEKPALTPVELQRLLGEIPERWQLLFQTLAVTGLRAGEVLGLQWKDLGWSSGALRISRKVWRGKVGPLKTDASRATVALPPAIVERLKAHHSQSAFRQPNDFLFCREDGSPWDQKYLLKFVLYPAQDRAKIQRGTRTHGFHLFRHSAGSILHERTGSLKRVQHLLRHARIETTADTYVHLSDQASRENAELLGEALDFCPPVAHQTPTESPYVN